MAAAVAGALISGVGMYAIGTHVNNGFAPNAYAASPAMGYYTGAPQPVAQGTTGYFVTTPQASAVPVAYTPPANYVPAPVVARTSASPQRTVYRDVRPAPVSRSVETRHRSVAKTALVIGGSTAGAAGLGGLIGGKKGALVGAALGGGAASIYEATRR